MRHLKYVQPNPTLLWVREGEGNQNNPPNGGAARNNAATNNTISQEDYEAALTRARREERSRLHGDLEKERQERQNAQRELEDLRKKQRETELAQMQPNERHEARIRELEATIQQTTQQYQQSTSQIQAELRATQLAAYRERVLRHYGSEIFPQMVVGRTEEEIDQAADNAHKEWKRMRDQMEQELMQQYQQQHPPQVSQAQPIQQQQYPRAFVPPPNPAYPSLQHQNPSDPQNGFPTPTNAEPPAEGPVPFNLKQLTSEQAVRSGRWGGEMREQVLAQLKGQSGGYIPNLGSAPRHFDAPVQYQTMPGGVQQPQGNPSGPAQNPQMAQYQQQQPVMTPAQQQASQVPSVVTQGNPGASQSAAEAIQRTRNGQNPTMAQTQGAHQALSQAQSHASNPQAAFNPSFQQRFAPTPPIQSNQN